MPEPIGFVVLTWNQVASLLPEQDIAGGMHYDLADAEWCRDLLTSETEDAGRGERHRVYAVVPLKDDDA